MRVIISLPGIVLFDDELFCSLKNELSEVSAQIDAQSAKLMGLIDQKKEYPLN